MVHGDRSVDVFVRKLRSKVEQASPGWVYIHTHFGIGYRFQAEPAGGDDSPPPAPHSPADDDRRVDDSEARPELVSLTPP
jgi:hypothetical protein